MAALVAAIHAFLSAGKTWMAGTEAGHDAEREITEGHRSRHADQPIGGNLVIAPGLTATQKSRHAVAGMTRSVVSCMRPNGCDSWPLSAMGQSGNENSR